jgi:hypothetical protein
MKRSTCLPMTLPISPRNLWVELLTILVNNDLSYTRFAG